MDGLVNIVLVALKLRATPLLHAAGSESANIPKFSKKKNFPQKGGISKFKIFPESAQNVVGSQIKEALAIITEYLLIPNNYMLANENLFLPLQVRKVQISQNFSKKKFL